MPDDRLTLGRAALSELHEAARQAGVDPLAFERAPSPPSRFGPSFRFPEWDGSSFVEPAPSKPVATEEVDGQRLPIDVGKVPRETPNLDKVKRWQAQQMRAGGRP